MSILSSPLNRLTALRTLKVLRVSMPRSSAGIGFFSGQIPSNIQEHKTTETRGRVLRPTPWKIALRLGGLSVSGHDSVELAPKVIAVELWAVFLYDSHTENSSTLWLGD